MWHVREGRDMRTGFRGKAQTKENSWKTLA